MRRWLPALMALLICIGHSAVAEDEESLEEDRVKFVIANTIFVLLHELAHGIIHEFDVPVLGEEEDAADTIASLLLLNAERLNPERDRLANRVLLSAGEGHKLTWETGIEEANIDMYYWARHSLSIRRYHRIVCLIYGSDPERFEELPELADMPEYRSDSCEDEYDLAQRSVETLIRRLDENAPSGSPDAGAVPVNRTDTDDSLGLRLQGVLREREIPRQVLAAVASIAPLPSGMTIAIEDCEYPGAYWDPENNELMFCYQLLSTFYKLSADQGLPALLREMDIPFGGQN